MLSVLIALVLLTSVINYISYRNVVSRSDWALSLLAKNGGSFPQSFFDRKENRGSDGEDTISKRIKGLPQGNSMFRTLLENELYDSEIPFESRYFSVLVDKNHRVTEIDTSQVFSVDNTTARTLQRKAQKELTKDGSKSFINGYRCTRTAESGGTRYIFLDCAKSLDNFRAFRNISILIVSLGLIIVFALLFFISGRVLKPVEESYEKQRRFITDAGHEIRTPLTIINADLSILEMEQEGDEPSEWLTDIKQQTARLAKLTEELVYLTRMEEVQKSSPSMTTFDLSETARELARSFDARAKVSGKTYEYTVNEDIFLHGDQSSIQKLISILLDNAFKYSTSEGDISFSLISSGKNIFLTVSNAVDSIDDDTLTHLFDRFYRADSSRNSETGGHGIGLSIAQAVVHAHGGKIAAYAPDGNQLRITATLPQA